MTDADLRALEQAASPAPWREGRDEEYDSCVLAAHPTSAGAALIVAACSDEDAALIVAARNALPGLLGRVAAAEADRDYLVGRMVLADRRASYTGVSSNAMVRVAFSGGDAWYPSDRWDWRRCLLAYALAPDELRERMRPTMREYRARLDPRYRRWLGPKSPCLADARAVLAAGVASGPAGGSPTTKETR